MSPTPDPYYRRLAEEAGLLDGPTPEDRAAAMFPAPWPPIFRADAVLAVVAAAVREAEAAATLRERRRCKALALRHAAEQDDGEPEKTDLQNPSWHMGWALRRLADAIEAPPAEDTHA